MSTATALDGLLVLDLTTFLSGPYCTMMLGDMGAEVIKVERPDGDEARRMPPFVEGRSQPFALWNRNKRSIALDLKTANDAALLWKLVAKADVLVENFRPGALERAGFGWDALHRANPRLVVASISGFGQSGPWAQHGPGTTAHMLTRAALARRRCREGQSDRKPPSEAH
jgi:CoA:oxalate CoA-transferase